MRRLLATLAGAVAVAALPASVPAAARAAQAGAGVIAYVRDADAPEGVAAAVVYVARADGSGERVFAEGEAPALAPDDTSVAYVVRAGGAKQLVTGRLDDAASFRQVTALPNREAEFGPGRYGVTGAVWSPGRTWLALRLMEGSTTTLGFVRPDGSGFARQEFGHLFGSTVAWRDDSTVAVGTDEGLRLVGVDGTVTTPPGATRTDTPAAWLDAGTLVVNTADGADVLDVASGKRASLLGGAVAWGRTPAGDVAYTTGEEIGVVAPGGKPRPLDRLPAGGQVLRVVAERDPMLVEVADGTGIRIYAVGAAGGPGTGIGASAPLRPAVLDAIADGSDVTASDAAAYDAVVTPPAPPPTGPPATAPPAPPPATTAPPETTAPAEPPRETGDPGALAAAPGPVDPPPGRSTFTEAVPTAGEVSTRGETVLVNLLLTLLLMLLVTFPAELFNSTLEEHYDEVRGWFRRRPLPGARGHTGPAAPRPPRPRAVRVAAFLGYAAVAALLYGLLDPEFGFDATSARLYLGLFVGLVVVTLVFSAAPLAYVRRRYRERGLLRVLPGTLLVGVVCVVVSRAARFEPGYLYGIVAGFAFSRAFSKEEEGRNALVAAACAFAVSLLAWVVWQPVDAAARDGEAGLLLGIADTTLATIAVGGLQGLVIGLVPVRSLQGYPLARWRRPLWAALYGVVLFTFVHLLLHPAGGFGADAKPVPFFTWLGLFVGFGVVSVAFWGYFRLRPEPRASSG